jgi:hypothetical protein
VIDEWVFHDLAGDNGEERRKEALGFLHHLKRICDHMAAPRGSPWAKKLCMFIEHANRSAALVALRNFLKSVLLDACKVRLSADLPSIEEPVNGCVPSKDRYLVQVSRALDAEALVTTDSSLLEACAKVGVKAVGRDEFLRAYLPGDVR